METNGEKNSVGDVDETKLMDEEQGNGLSKNSTADSEDKKTGDTPDEDLFLFLLEQSPNNVLNESEATDIIEWGISKDKENHCCKKFCSDFFSALCGIIGDWYLVVYNEKQFEDVTDEARTRKELKGDLGFKCVPVPDLLNVEKKRERMDDID